MTDESSVRSVACIGPDVLFVVHGEDDRRYLGINWEGDPGTLVEMTAEQAATLAGFLA